MVNPSAVQFTGALATHRQGLWDAWLALGYTPLSAANLLRLAAHLSRWLDAQGLALDELTHERIEAFFAARRHSGYTQFRTPRALAPIVHHLERVGAISHLAPPAPEPTALEQVIEEYTRYLLHERSVSEVTARAYGDIARRFLEARCPQACKARVALRASDVTSFVLEASSHYSVGATKYIVTALRSFLRHLYLEQRLAADLTGAVPAVAGWRLQGLPKALGAQELRRLLGSCDRRRHVGRRDYAVMLLMARLGLRRGEVAALALEDIDWRTGEFLVRGKGHSVERLPLPDDVGQAITRYLRASRPRASARALFLTVRAPHRALSACAVGGIVRNACTRTGLPASSAHRLRHTAATAMLRAGACLDEIAQVLRHRSHDTTAIYAKVERTALSAVVRRWPGAAS